jgi:membrane dipeptidase
MTWYRAMEQRGEMVQMKTRGDLQRQVKLWNGASITESQLPIGYVLSLEGADSILSFQHLERSYEQGLRALGPAHYGPGLYAQGTDASGKFPARGRELLREMDRLGMILDVTHLTDEEFREALDLYQGPIWASHSDCRTLAPHQRQLSDEQIKALAQRGAVIGAALDAWMMVPDWVRQKTTPQAVGLTLEKLVEHIDHVCQIAGNANHAGIGSDLDGGFGTEQTPMDLKTIANLARIPELLRARGYEEEDVSNIAHGNFFRFLNRALPE